MLRVAIIGMGPIGNRHADMYRLTPLAELVGVCDIIPERADRAGARLGVPAFYSAPEMLARLKPDLVSVTTAGVENGGDHYLPVMQTLEAGINVLCEKPISNEIPKAVEMVAKAKEKGLYLATNMNHRFNQAHRMAKQWIEEGRLGTLLFMNMSMWIMNPQESSPFYMIQALNPHTVDIMRYFCGDIAAVHCFATTAPGRTLWSTATFNMRFKSGAVGTLTASYDIERGHPMERAEVAGNRGRFVIEDMFQQVTLYPAGNLQKTVYTNPIFGGMYGFEDTFKDRIHKLVGEISAGVPRDEIDGSGADGLAAQKVLAAAIESIKTGQVVAVT
jgi:predicted dehydrogenase